MTADPFLDVLVPFYGDEGMLRETVGSVLAQDAPGWRLTVVDDRVAGDGVQRWLDGLGDDRVRYVRNAVNLGANRNFQRCLDLARAPRCTILGSDDLLLPGYVGRIRQMSLAHPGAAMLHPGVLVVDGAGEPVRPLADRVKARLAPRGGQRVLRGEPLAASLLRGNWLYFPAIAWHTETTQAVGFTDGLSVVMDLQLELQLVSAGHELVVDPEVVFAYRRHGASESSWRAGEGSRFVEEREFFGRWEAEMRRLGWGSAATAARRHVTSRLHALSVAATGLRRGHVSGVRRALRHAVR